MNSIPMRQDFCLWLDILEACEEAGFGAVGVDEPLAEYRLVPGSLSSGKLRAATFQWKALRGHAGLSWIESALCFSSYAVRAVRERLRRAPTPG